MSATATAQRLIRGAAGRIALGRDARPVVGGVAQAVVSGQGFRPLAPPVAVWAAFGGRFADVAAAAGSRAVGRRWAWRCVAAPRRGGPS